MAEMLKMVYALSPFQVVENIGNLVRSDHRLNIRTILEIDKECVRQPLPTLITCTNLNEEKLAKIFVLTLLILLEINIGKDNMWQIVLFYL